MAWFRSDGEFDEEVQTHLDLLEERYLRQGMTPDEARLAARRQFGNRSVLEQTRREMSPWVGLETLWQDVRFGARALRRHPGFTAVAVLTLALGIGANTAIFSVVKAVLLDRLPYTAPERLVTISEVSAAFPDSPEIDYTTLQRFRARSRSFSNFAAYRDGASVLAENGRREMVRGLAVTYDFFDVLGVKMQLGRSFLPEEGVPGRDTDVILSHDLWVRRFGADPHIVGRILHYRNANRRVVGVLPAGFRLQPGKAYFLPPHLFRP